MARKASRGKARPKPRRSLRWWLRTGLAIVLVGGLAWGWTQVSPWPAAMAIRAAFAIGGHTAAEKQRKHVPAGLTEVLDI